MQVHIGPSADPKNRVSFPSQQPSLARPLITMKDILWALYLYPGRLLSRIPSLTYRLIDVAEPVVQVLSTALKKDLVQKFATALASEKQPVSFDQLARRYIANDVRRTADDLLLERTSANLRCISFQGREHLEKALAVGKGVMLLSLHWFAERAAKRYLDETGYPVMSVRHRIPPDQHMGRLGRQFLQPRYINFLHGVIGDEVFLQDPECSLKMLRRLRGNGIVSILVDAPFSRELIELPFLGQIRDVPTGPLHLAKISGCEVLPMVALGHAQALEIRIEEALTFDRTLSPKEFCQAYLPPIMRIFESHVMEHADQWDCWRKRWRKPRY